MPDIPEALAAEYELRAKRATAVATVDARLQAARTEAEGQSAVAATVTAVLRSRVAQLRAQQERLELEHADALAPTPEVAAAEAALAAAAQTSRTVPIDDDDAATAAAHAQANAEDWLKAAKQEADARNVRPLQLRLQITTDQAGAATRELAAAEAVADTADQDLRRVLREILRLRRDAAAMALDEATVDLIIARGAQHADSTQLTLGESSDLMSELGQVVDSYFGSAPRWRSQAIGRVDPALLVDSAAPAESDTVPKTARKAGKLLAA